MNCGCCDCLNASAQGDALPNRPGLGAIARRVGTHGSFYERMIGRLSAIDPATQRAGALAALTTREKNDPAIALLDAWATCADVLAFYQERFANEGYLRTARERRSVLELARLVGYTLQPGVSASTYVAYTVDAKATTLIPAGAKVQSVPLLPEEQPQIFETAEEIEARGAWNLLVPRMTEPQTVNAVELRRTGFRLYIEGAEHNLGSGDALLFQYTNNTFDVAWIRDVEPDRVANRTAVTFHRVVSGSTADPTAVVVSDAAVTQVGTGAAVTALDVSVTSLLEETSVPPASRHDMAASFEDRFGRTSDFRLLALGNLVPKLKNVPTLLEHAPQNVPSEVSGVWVLRNKTALFGYNAPATTTIVTGPPDDATITMQVPVPEPNVELPNRIHLESQDDAIDIQSFVVLLKGKQVLVRRVMDALTVPRAAYGLAAKVTRLDLDVKWWNAGANEFPMIRGTAVLARSEPLTLAWQPIVEDVGATRTIQFVTTPTDEKNLNTQGQLVVVKGKTIALESIAEGLGPGRWIIITGERADLPGVHGAELAMISKIEQTIFDDDQPVFSIIHIAGEGLAYTYKRDTVKIYGNVVKVTHGETRAEFLGNGDATQRLQSFTLRHAPMTWVAAANPSGVVTTLQVRVHDALWREVPSLAGAGPADRVYVTKTNDDGKTTVTFGTGESGARLPTGSDNVRAVYRSGIGRSGNARAGQINIAVTRPVGVREVLNPIEATGGADPESRDQARLNVPLAVRALGRVVSVRDYEDFARTFAGIAKAQARLIPKGRGRTVLLTIAGDGEMDVLPTSDLYRALVEALRKYGDPLQPLAVVNREKMLMTGSARVQPHPDYEWRTVAPRVRASLLDEFSFERRQLGQPIFPSEVVAAIQRVEGVAWVDLDTLVGVHSSELLEGQQLVAKLEPIVPPRADLIDGKWTGAGLAYLPASLTDAFLLQEVPHAGADGPALRTAAGRAPAAR